MADLRWKHGVAPQPDELTGTNERDLWLAGRVAMVLNGTHFLGSTRQANVSFEWDVVLPPKGTAKRAGLIRMAVCGMLAGARQQAAAWTLLKHLSTPESQRAWARASLMPARPSAASAFIAKPPASVEKVIEAGNWRGKQVGLTPDGCAVLEYVNATLFQEAGVPLPRTTWTWNDYLTPRAVSPRAAAPP